MLLAATSYNLHVYLSKHLLVKYFIERNTNVKVVASTLNGDVLRSSQIAKPEDVRRALMMNDNTSNITSADREKVSILPFRSTLTRIMVNTTNVKQKHIASCNVMYIPPAKIPF